jgi:hypothetical protein
VAATTAHDQDVATRRSGRRPAIRGVELGGGETIEVLAGDPQILRRRWFGRPAHPPIAAFAISSSRCPST